VAADYPYHRQDVLVGGVVVCGSQSAEATDRCVGEKASKKTQLPPPLKNRFRLSKVAKPLYVNYNVVINILIKRGLLYFTALDHQLKTPAK
jgi:hypothetical protein